MRRALLRARYHLLYRDDFEAPSVRSPLNRARADGGVPGRMREEGCRLCG